MDNVGKNSVIKHSFGNGTTDKDCDDWGMVNKAWHCFTTVLGDSEDILIMILMVLEVLVSCGWER